MGWEKNRSTLPHLKLLRRHLQRAGAAKPRAKRLLGEPSSHCCAGMHTKLTHQPQHTLCTMERTTSFWTGQGQQHVSAQLIKPERRQGGPWQGAKGGHSRPEQARQQASLTSPGQSPPQVTTAMCVSCRAKELAWVSQLGPEVWHKLCSESRASLLGAA